MQKEKVSMVSLGCPKNLVDAEVMLGYLGKEGYEITTDEHEADIIIVNTCSFIKEAKQESIDTILDLADRKHDASCKLLVVTGCLPQRYQEELSKELPEVDIFVGTGDYLKIAEGCSNCCSYCVIPSLRGKFRSRPLNLVMEEARRLVGGGVKELNLIAQDITVYG